MRDQSLLIVHLRKPICTAKLLVSLFVGVFLSFFFATTIYGQEVSGNLKFIENHSQWDDRVEFMADIYGGAVFLEKNTFTYSFYDQGDFAKYHHKDLEDNIQDDLIDCHAFQVMIVGANPSPTISGNNMLTEYRNYYIGNDKSKWASNVKVFRAVNYSGILPSIDLNVYSQFNNLKYDFVVAPNGDANRIQLQYTGMDTLYLSGNDLNIVTSVNSIVEQRPYAYQIINGQKRVVPCDFTLVNNNVGFSFPEGYESGFELVIDPVLVFSTYSGSLSAEVKGFTATYDTAGNMYSGGRSWGSGYPVTLGSYQTSYGGWFDIAISKFNYAGTGLIYATYLGGSTVDQPLSMVVNNNDELLVLGTTFSANFPIIGGAYDASHNGSYDIVVSRLNAAGTSLLSSTFLGGTGADGLNGILYNYGDGNRGEIITDSVNNCYIALCTRSSDFPATPGVFQNSLNGNQDGCIAKFDTSLSTLIWSSFIGGSDTDAVYSITVDNSYNVYVTGGTKSGDFPTTAGTLDQVYIGGSHDGFVTKVSPDGTTLLSSTFIGTAAYDQSFLIQLDRNLNIYLFGQTEGNYPVVGAAYANPNSGQFVTKINNTLSSVIFSTVLGNGSGIPNISPTAFLVDACGRLYFSGFTDTLNISANLPLTPDAYQSTTDSNDFYFMVLDVDASSLLFGTYFGGTGEEHVDGGTCRFDKNGVAYISVCSNSLDFPTTAGAYATTNQVWGVPPYDICSFRFNLGFPELNASITPVSLGCIPYSTTFTNNGTGGSIFYWDFGDGDTSMADNPPHTYTTADTFLVRLIAEDVSCNTFDTAYTTVIVDSSGVNADINSIIPADSGCAPYTATFTNASLGGSIYYWDFGDGDTSMAFSPTHTFDSTGIYSVQLIAKNNGCNISDTTTTSINVYTVNVNAIITSTTPADSGCAPLTTTFNNGSINGDKFYWDLGDGDTSMAFSPTHTYTSTGSYQIQLIAWNSDCNIYDTTFTTITAISLALDLDQDTAICQNESVILSAGNVGASYVWSTGDTSQTINVTTAGSYMVTITSGGCVGSDTITISLNSLPTVDAGNDVTIGCEPTELQASSSGPVTYSWKPESGLNTPFISNPIALPMQTTNYIVTATDSNNCKYSDSVMIYVDILTGLDIPNAFSPNGDGVNDIIYVVSRCLAELEFKVYNRFGKLVFETNDITEGWDGTYKGKLQPIETYVFFLRGTSLIGETYSRQGNITLFR